MAEIEYFYAAHSAFAYLGSAAFMRIAKAADRAIAHRPVDLRKVIDACGSVPFGKRTKAHVQYYFHREIERWSEERDAPWVGRIPTHHRNDITLPNCTLIAARQQGHNIDRLAHAMLEQHWRDDVDLADAPTLAKIARSVDLDPDPILAATDSAEVRKTYDAYTEEAIERSMFGSPTYFVDGDMFYGQDRLDMVERALRKPYAGDWPRKAS
ncbi:MAG: 2-hydroxychromene-2-carboxylate isomerase [Alphaproteobacteria bacterium]